MSLYNLSQLSVPILKAMQIPEPKVVVEKGWNFLKKNSLARIQSKKQKKVREDAQKAGQTPFILQRTWTCAISQIRIAQ